MILNYAQELRNAGLASGDTIDERNRKAQQDRLFAQREQAGGLALAKEQAAFDQQQKQAVINKELEATAQKLFQSGDHQGLAEL